MKPENRFDICSLYPDSAAHQIYRKLAVQTEVSHLRRDASSLAAQLGYQGGRRTLSGTHESLIQAKNRLQLIKGQPEQLAIWDVRVGKAIHKSFLLQPPAELRYHAPTNRCSTFAAAIAMHPEVRTNPQSGGCEFKISINGWVAFVAGLNPTKIKGTRQWLDLSLPVPENPAGPHEIILETRSIDSNSDFR